MAKIQISETKKEKYVNQMLVLSSTDLSDFEAFQVLKYIEKHFTDEETVKIEITTDNVFFIAKTEDNRDFLYNVAYRGEVLVDSGALIDVLSIIPPTPANDFEVKLL